MTKATSLPALWIGLPRPVAIGFLALALAVVVGYTVAWREAPVEASDSAGYFAVAHDLADFRLERLHYRPPGYPMWLRLLGFVEHHATKRLVAAGLLLYVFGLWTLTLVLQRLELSQRGLMLFVLLLSLPPFVEPAAYVLSENLAQFLLDASLVAVVFWLWRRQSRYLWLAGSILAAAALTKPTYVLLAPALASSLALSAFLFDLQTRRAARAGLLLIGISALPVAGFVLFNGYRFGYFTISPGNLAYSLSTKTVRLLERLPDEYAEAREAMIAVRDENLVERGSSHTAEQYFPRARAAVAEVTGLEGEELDALMLRLQLRLIAEAPLSYLHHVGQSVVSFWYPSVGRINFGPSGLLHIFWAGLQILVVGWFGLQLFVVGGLGVFELSRRLAQGRLAVAASPLTGSRVTVYLLALCMIVYTMAVSCLVHHGDPRFRTVNDPLIVLLCFLGSSMWHRLLVATGRGR